MAMKRSAKATPSPEQQKLDSLNARMRIPRKDPKSIRRLIEASIEAKAKRRRGRETAASAAWKK